MYSAEEYKLQCTKQVVVFNHSVQDGWKHRRIRKLNIGHTQPDDTETAAQAELESRQRKFLKRFRRFIHVLS